MEIAVKVIADSIWWPTPDQCHRLTTIEATYQRYIHSEVKTHRMLSGNSASSRAIPVSKMLKQVWSDPAMPVWWGKNQPGMKAKAELVGWRKWLARKLWVLSGCMMVGVAWGFSKIGLHKQIANRILEPWMWMKTILSATEWGHMLNLRQHPDAQPEFKALADKIHEALISSTPQIMREGDWHLPYLNQTEKNWRMLFGDFDEDPMYFQKLSSARCARVSYLNHDGSDPDYKKDLELHGQLIAAPHASPFEHQATPCQGRHGNFIGWKQYRQLIPNEYNPEHAGVWPYQK